MRKTTTLGLVAFLFMLLVSPATTNALTKTRLAASKTENNIYEFTKANFGHVESVKIMTGEQPLLVLWAGDEANAFLFGYMLVDSEWKLFLDELILPGSLVIIPSGQNASISFVQAVDGAKKTISLATIGSLAK